MKKTQSQIEGDFTKWLVSFKSVKVRKDKEKLRNGPRSEETKKSGQLNTIQDSRSYVRSEKKLLVGKLEKF